MKNRKHFIIVAVLIVISTLALRWVLSIIFANPIAASAEAISIDTLSNAHYWMISFLFSLIMVFMLYAAVVFRRDPDDQEDGPHVHGNTMLEIVWTVIPLIIVIAFGVWGAIMLNDITRADNVDMRVGVEAEQWSWSFNYPEQGGFTSPELVLPVNHQIMLEMRTKDVIHNFWVVEFRVKQDLLPGSTQELRITPTETGEYVVRCAEICGLSHSMMLAPVRVVTDAEFAAWVEERLAAPKFAEMTPEERGAFWHSAEGFACIGCHSLDGAPGAGPTWQGIYGREEVFDDGTSVIVDDEYISNSIINPNANIVEGFLPNVMPQTYVDLFAERQAEILANEGVEIDIIADLIAFMRTLEE
jgi:cytochrome c oxidase subunit II